MEAPVIYGLLIPFVGTSLGSACVFFLKKGLGNRVQRGLTGFASVVMVAASIWSLLIPTMEQSAGKEALAFLPAVIGFWAGILFLLGLDHLIPHLHQKSSHAEGPHTQLRRSTMMVLAVTLHNIPEGMAVVVVYAGYLARRESNHRDGRSGLISGHRHPELPRGGYYLNAPAGGGNEQAPGLCGGVLSGAVEPLGALLTILAAGLVIPALPYLLSFAAGAMIYVVVEELIPEMSQGEHSDVGTLTFALGFTLMMALDVALG